MKKREPMAMLPEHKIDHQYCTVCCDDNVVLVITARYKEIVFCSKCAGKLLEDMSQLNLGLNYDVVDRGST